METQIIVPGEYQASRLNHLVRHITESLAPATLRNKSLVINDVPEGILINNNPELLATVLSTLMNLVVMHSENSRIRITAKLFGDVVLLHVKDDGCLNYDSISQNLVMIQSLAEKMGGYVGFTSFRNKLTTIALSFTNIAAAA